jgi:single-strand DNA-binding protein
MTSRDLVILAGKVARPPHRHSRPDGSLVLQFRFEVSDRENQATRKGKNLIDIVAFGKLAELELSLFQSGQPLLVKGQLKERRWQTPEGKHRVRVEIIATDLQRLEESSPSEDQSCSWPGAPLEP